MCTKRPRKYPNATPLNLHKRPEDAAFAAFREMAINNVMSLPRR